MSDRTIAAKERRAWERGMDAGCLCALAVIADNDGPDSTIYKEIVRNFGLDGLILAARRDRDGQLTHLVKLRRERDGTTRAARRKATSTPGAVPPSESLP